MSVQQQAGPARAVFAGVDWAENNHVVCLVDTGGEVVDRLTVAHDKASIARLITVLRDVDVAGWVSNVVTGRWSPPCSPPD